MIFHVLVALVLSLTLFFTSAGGEVRSSSREDKRNPFHDYAKNTKKRCKRKNKGATGPTGPTGSTGVRGFTGATGPAGQGSASSYGQLSTSSSTFIEIDQEETWVAIPFATFGPSLNITGSTTSPATITIQHTGVYQVNVCIYFEAQDSQEGSFSQNTYTLGVAINGNPPISSAAVYAGDPGAFSLNFSQMFDLNTDDYLQFYIKASNISSPPYSNHIYLENGSASLLQIGS